MIDARMSTLILVTFALSGCLMTAGQPAEFSSPSNGVPPGAPSPGGTAPILLNSPAIGAWVGPVDLSKLSNYETYLNRPMDYINDTVPSEDWDHMTNASLYYYYLANWKTVGGTSRLVITIPMIPTFGKYDGPTLNDAAASQALQDGANGMYDAYWVTARQKYLSSGFTTNFVRLGWEMNGSWYNWRASANPTAWVAYWRRIAGILNDDPAMHLRFVWNPTLADQSIAAETVYPGDDLVSAIGIDVYDSDYSRYPAGSGNLAVQMDVWDQTVLNGPHGLAFYSAFAKTHGKPIHIDEWGVGPASSHMGGDNVYFVQSLVDWSRDPANNVTLMMEYDDPSLVTGSTSFPNASARLKSLLGK